MMVRMIINNQREIYRNNRIAIVYDNGKTTINDEQIIVILLYMMINNNKFFFNMVPMRNQTKEFIHSEKTNGTRCANRIYKSK